MHTSSWRSLESNVDLNRAASTLVVKGEAAYHVILLGSLTQTYGGTDCLAYVRTMPDGEFERARKWCPLAPAIMATEYDLFARSGQVISPIPFTRG
jgi:hypothetical protein